MKNLEYFDVYDRNHNKTEKTKIRYVDALEEGEYIVGVQLVIFNKRNEILITKRSKKKKLCPEKWECNGGAIDVGETSIEGLVREMREELGITIDKDNVVFFKTVINDERHNIKDIYLFKGDIDINNIEFSDDEVCDAKYVSIGEFMDMYKDGEIVYNVDFDAEDYKKAMQIL